ncbi:MAG: cell division protein FtsQ/DivIB [Gaiellaceae bacterium]
MAGGRTERGSHRHARAASVVVPFPRGAAGDRLHLARFVPSGRSLLVGFGVVLGALGIYWGAHVSSVFAVDRVEVLGAPPEIEREVEAATKGVVGANLVTVDPAEIEGALRALPSVAGASVDRAFPHTLVVKIAPERAVAVARRGQSSWLVTGAGKVIRAIETGSERTYPRIWLTRGVAVRVGGMLPLRYTPATRALAAAIEGKLPRRVKAVRADGDDLTLVLRRGAEIRLGEPTDLGLKVAVATAVFRLVEPGTTYIDVSVPERPVAGL